MISDYKFQDLAKFIEDVQFLMSRGGGMQNFVANNFAGKSVPEIILRVVWLFLLWVFIIIVVYMVYQIIFKGYPRFPIDLLKLKFYNKVDVKGTIGGVNGMLFQNIFNLTDPSMKEAIAYFTSIGIPLTDDQCIDTPCKDVFSNMVEMIDKYYEPVYSTSKVDMALSDYFTYYSTLSNKLGARGLKLEDKIKKMEEINEKVSSYMTFYQDVILDQEREIDCLVNDGKDDGTRKVIADTKKDLERELKDLFKKFNIVKVTTTKSFAKAFLDPSIGGQCGPGVKEVIQKILNGNGYNAKKSALMKAEKHVKKTKTATRFAIGNKKKKQKQKLHDANNAVVALRNEMAVIRVEAEQQAKKLLKDMKFPSSTDGITSKTVLMYEDQDRVYPNLTVDKMVEKSGHQYVVYVPCYDVYKEYLTLNKDTMFVKFTKEMNEGEIIAFIFLTDLESMMENKESRQKNSIYEDDDSQDVKPVLIQRLLNMYLAIEKMGSTVKLALESSKSPANTCQYLVFPDESFQSTAVSELIVNRNLLIKAYSGNKFASMKVINDYTYYLMEVFFFLTASKNEIPASSLYELYAGQFVSLINRGLVKDDIVSFNKKISATLNAGGVSAIQNMIPEVQWNNIITVLNLSQEMQNNPAILTKYNVSQDIVLFARRHPIFSMMFFNTPPITSKTYQDVMDTIKSLLGNQPDELAKLQDIQTITATDVTSNWNYLQDKVFNIKKILTGMHVVNLYLSHYRDSVQQRDPITKVKISKDGLIDISSQQNISYEFDSFFKRLFQPFKMEFIDGRIVAAWRSAFYGPKFNPNLKKDKMNISYWREFNSFWIDYMGRKMDGMMKSWWQQFKNFTKPRWNK